MIFLVLTFVVVANFSLSLHFKFKTNRICLEVVKIKYKIIKINQLKQHEQIITKHFDELKDQIIENKYIIPIVVDSKNNIILDGHHRYNVLKFLGYEQIPAYFVDYDSDYVKVESWRLNVKVTKKDVLDRGISGNLFPSKTSKNIIKNIENNKVELGDLK